MTWKSRHTTDLAREFGIDVDDTDPSLPRLNSREDHDELLNRLEQDGWEVRHILGIPSDPVLYLWKPTSKQARLVN